MTMQAHVALSLINKAPVGLLLTALIAVIANIIFDIDVMIFAYAVIGGALSAFFLLLYWLAKGGVFFIIGVSAPLLLVLLTPLAAITALLNLVSGFFFGFCITLVTYKFVTARR